MSVGVFPLMQQLFIVYVKEKYKNYWSLFSAFDTNCEERREAIVFTGYVIQQFNFNIKR